MRDFFKKKEPFAFVPFRSLNASFLCPPEIVLKNTEKYQFGQKMQVVENQCEIKKRQKKVDFS